MTGAEVVDLKAPMAFVAFVAKLTGRILALVVQVGYPLSQLEYLAMGWIGPKYAQTGKLGESTSIPSGLIVMGKLHWT